VETVNDIDEAHVITNDIKHRLKQKHPKMQQFKETA